MNIPRILLKIRPNARWAMNGIAYEGIIWLDEIQTKPTLEEIEAAWPSVQVDIAAEEAEKQEMADAIATKLPSSAKIKARINKLQIDDDTKAFLADISEVLYQHIKETTNGGA